MKKITWMFPKEGKDQSTQIFHIARNLKNEDLKTSQKFKINKNSSDD